MPHSDVYTASYTSANLDTLPNSESSIFGLRSWMKLSVRPRKSEKKVDHI